MERYAIFGDILYSEADMKVAERPSSYLIIRDGKVEGIERERPRDMVVHDYEGMLIIPGLIDMHLHAPQYQFAGLYMDEELLDWLNSHTFPEEGKYSDLNYAEKAYHIFTQDLLRCESTRFSLFATIHSKSTLLLASMLEKAGFAGYVGKVNMDQNSPDYLCEDTEASIKSTVEVIEAMKSLKNIKPIITPRFIPSCSRALLTALSGISEEYDIPVRQEEDDHGPCRMADG